MLLSKVRPVAAVRSLGLTGAIILALLPLAACSDDNTAILHTAKGDFTFHVEIADDDAERAKGLMFRQSLAADAGMLFDFKEVREVSFWMQNTLIPLDMIFIGPDGVVENVHVNARPLDTTSIGSQAPVQFVLEIPGGRSVEIGLAKGDKMDHPRVTVPAQ